MSNKVKNSEQYVVYLCHIAPDLDITSLEFLTTPIGFTLLKTVNRDTTPNCVGKTVECMVVADGWKLFNNCI